MTDNKNAAIGQFSSADVIAGISVGLILVPQSMFGHRSLFDGRPFL
jgi:MFS superfamily sulfate permease-like transporter